jgi:hypothetical protein
MLPACPFKQRTELLHDTVLSDSPTAAGVFPPLGTSVSCKEKSGNDANLRKRNGKSNYFLGKNVFVHLHSPIRELFHVPGVGAAGGGQSAPFILQNLIIHTAR